MIDDIMQKILDSDPRETTFTEYKGFEFVKYAHETFYIKHLGTDYCGIVGIDKLKQYIEKHYKGNDQGVLFG